jgi:hypothetical protein
MRKGPLFLRYATDRVICDGTSVINGIKGGINVLISNYLKSEGITSLAPFVHLLATI